METRIGNDIILDIDPKIFGVNNTDSIESTEAIFVRYEEPCCHDNCCSQFCNPAPCCNGGCNYYNTSPVNIYGIPTHCPPPKQYQYVDKIDTVQNTDKIKHCYPGNKQIKCGLFTVLLMAQLKNSNSIQIKLDDTIRLVESGKQETVTIKVNSNITNTSGSAIDPTNIPTGINLSHYGDRLAIALQNDDEDISGTIVIPEASNTKNGLMSIADKKKLDSLFDDGIQFVIKDNYLYVTDDDNNSYKISMVKESTTPVTPSDKYNVYVGFGPETITSIDDITNLKNSVHYILKDVSTPDTEDGAYHITSTEESLQNNGYIWVCSEQSFKRITSNGFTIPSESTINIESYYCKRSTNAITMSGDNIIEIVK